MQPRSEERVIAAAEILEQACRNAGLMETDYFKAIMRIKINVFGANLAGLKLRAKSDANWQEEVIALALAAFERAQQCLKPDSDGDCRNESKDVLAMERAAKSLGG